MIWFFLTCYTVLFVGLVSMIGFVNAQEQRRLWQLIRLILLWTQPAL